MSEWCGPWCRGFLELPSCSSIWAPQSSLSLEQSWRLLQRVLGKHPQPLRSARVLPDHSSVCLAQFTPDYLNGKAWINALDPAVPCLTQSTRARPAGRGGSAQEGAPALCPGAGGDGWWEVWGLRAGSLPASVCANQPLTFKKRFYCSSADFSLQWGLQMTTKSLIMGVLNHGTQQCQDLVII